MDFLRLFDLVDFDKDGNVCQTKRFALNKARSNYLYLLCKYNQRFLEEENLAIPQFFKEDLYDLLENVEKGGDFSKAKKKVLENCLPKIQLLAKKSGSDRQLLLGLNDKVVVKDIEFANKNRASVNNLALAYIITGISGQVEKKIEKQMDETITDQKSKSKLFKNVVKYNGLVSTADKVSKNELTVNDFAAMAM